MKPKLALMGAAAIATLALVLLLGTADSARAGTFGPILSICMDDGDTRDPDPVNPGDPEECDGDNSTGAHADWTLDFNLPEGDVNFAGVVFFIPSEWEITPGEEIPIGAVVGHLRADATLGLINGACANPLPVDFIMLNSSIDPFDTVSYLDTNPEPGDPGYDPQDPGTDTEDYTEDRDNSGLQDGFEKYPDFISRTIVDEDDNPQHPIRRAAGIAIVAGVNVLLQFLIFEPGTFIDEEIPNDESLGYPSVTLLQNAGDPDQDPIPSTITDFCTPLVSRNTTFGFTRDNPCTDDIPLEERDPICDVTSAPLDLTGESGTNPDESGIPLFTTPQEGTYTFTTIAAGMRDADGDGYENNLDTCALDPNEGDPRIKGDGDFDEDGLDTACDPNDDELNSDQDADGYLNRQDNCPLVPNGEEGTNQRDTDDDFIGDDCDPNPDEEDTEGELILVELSEEMTIGPGGPPSEDETPEATPAGDEDEDDGGGGIIFIVIGVIAAVVVLGGGAFFFMRRGGA